MVCNYLSFFIFWRVFYGGGDPSKTHLERCVLKFKVGVIGGLTLTFSHQRLNYTGFCVLEEGGSCVYLLKIEQVAKLMQGSSKIEFLHGGAQARWPKVTERCSKIEVPVFSEGEGGGRAPQATWPKVTEGCSKIDDVSELIRLWRYANDHCWPKVGLLS